MAVMRVNDNSRFRGSIMRRRRNKEKKAEEEKNLVAFGRRTMMPFFHDDASRKLYLRAVENAKLDETKRKKK